MEEDNKLNILRAALHKAKILCFSIELVLSVAIYILLRNLFGQTPAEFFMLAAYAFALYGSISNSEKSIDINKIFEELRKEDDKKDIEDKESKDKEA